MSTSQRTTQYEELSNLLTPLRNNEIKWRERYEMLERQGYRLRPRLRPGWKPSWLRSGRKPTECEDGELLPLGHKLVDATHIRTGNVVYIKEVKTNDVEHQIAKSLTREDWANDSRNHCAPVVKIFTDPGDPRVTYIVMPFLRPADDPPFELVKEIIDFVDQTLEGLAFLHGKGIAHRDCVMNKILMDANAMYPDGYHPIALNRKKDHSALAKYRSRATAGARYYYVDFGISVHVPDGFKNRLVLGTLGEDRDPPELSNVNPYDPFKLDIFIIGNMLKREFHDNFSNVQFLSEIIKMMIRLDPQDRPDANAVLEAWKGIRDNVSSAHQEWRVRPRKEHPAGTVVLDAVSLHRVFMYFVMALVTQKFTAINRRCGVC